MKEKKLCPMKRETSSCEVYAGMPITETSFGYCEEEKCAWYADDEGNGCGIKHLGYLAHLTELENIKRRMP